MSKDFSGKDKGVNGGENLFDSLMDNFSGAIEGMSEEEWTDLCARLYGSVQSKQANITQEKPKTLSKAKREAESKRLAEITRMDLPLDYYNSYDETDEQGGLDSASDGLIASLRKLGRVDIEYIASATGLTLKRVISDLRGSIFQNPDTWGEVFYKGFETADEYLSGNLMVKYNKALIANEKYVGFFDSNIDALAAILPPSITADKIYVTLGSPWVPVDIVNAFIAHLVNVPPYVPFVDYDVLTGTWTVDAKNALNRRDVRVNLTYGTSRLNMFQIIDRTLNMRSVKVTDRVSSKANASGFATVVNKDETALACEKQRLIVEEFKKWIFASPDRKQRLENIYNEKFATMVGRHFNGSFLTLPGSNPHIELYEHQKNAIARIILSQNTLLAHEVGTGKTYIMIAAGMEMRRMNVSKKNVYVVPNSIVGQWKSDFMRLYPKANLLVLEPKDFTKSKRQRVLADIRDNDYDGIIMAYSCFEMVEMSLIFYRDELSAELKEVKEAYSVNKSRALKQRQDYLVAQLKKIQEKIWNNPQNGICFEDLGINSLFIDEAHNFKNIPINTKCDSILGINKVGSQRCQEMLSKVRCVKRDNDGRGVVFATGTPITNSVTDMFVMQTYLQEGELKFLGLDHFDNWAQMFGEKYTDFEIDVDASGYRLATRFSRFHNLPELTAMFAQIADFHKLNREEGLPDFHGYTDTVLAKTYDQADYIEGLACRAERIRAGQVKRCDDNMLKISTDGRKAALDIRLVEPNIGWQPTYKVQACAEKVYAIWRASKNVSIAQLVFCDSSTPKQGFNMYNELKDILVRMGVPAYQIEFVHNATTDKQRAELFKRTRTGDIRVLIGSTFKLGIGVNVQDNLYAVHHLDIPWRPADMVQREGRILRQGNKCGIIEIHRYITEGSFDAYSWQLLETKQRFIDQLLSDCILERSGEEISDTVLDYAEVKALAVGNPLIRDRIETYNELCKLKTLQRDLESSRFNMQAVSQGLPSKIVAQRTMVRQAQQDVDFYKQFVADQRAKGIEEERVDLMELYDDDENSDSILKPTESEYEALFSARRSLGTELVTLLREHEMKDAESIAFVYKGFNIVLPSKMSVIRPFVFVMKYGKWAVEMSFSEIGCMARLDNFLQKQLPQKLELLQKNLLLLLKQQADIEIELQKETSYLPDIERLQHKLEKIDKELGVKKPAV